MNTFILLSTSSDSILKQDAMVAICPLDTVRTQFAPQPKWFGQLPNEPRTMNLLESGLDIERLMS